MMTSNGVRLTIVGSAALVLLAVLAASGGLVAAKPSDLALADGAAPLADGGMSTAEIAPSGISYQGRLWDDGASEWVTGRRTITFRIFNVPSGGTALWSETIADVLVRSGLFSVALGTDAAPFSGQALWLEAEVDGDGEPMTLRTALLPVPYALGLVPGAMVEGELDGAVLMVSNSGSRTGRRGSNGIWGAAMTAGAAGVYGSGSAAYGVEGESMSGIGVLGLSGVWAGGQPQPAGVYGVMGYSKNSHGVYGMAEAADAAGVWGRGLGLGVRGEGMTGVSGEGDIGVRGEGLVGVQGEGATAVYGDGVGVGVLGESGMAGVRGVGDQVGVEGDSPKIGVHGISRTDATTSAAVLAEANGRGIGVVSNSDSGFGGKFVSESNIGVLGLSTAATVMPVISGQHGVYGLGGDPTGSYGGYFVGDGGVYGQEQEDAGEDFAGYFAGDVRITDALDVDGLATFHGGKSGFVVDVCRSDDAGALVQGDVVVVTGVAPAVIGDIPVIVVRRATAAADTAVVGVVDRRFDPAGGQGEYGYELGQVSRGEYLTVVTHGAFATVRVDASLGPIRVGDLLVASATPGYAMRAVDPAVGTVIGKALGALSSGKGSIPVLVTLN